MSRPLVSIVITTYNRADLIRETIESCLRQDYQPFEIIVVDDGSTDNTEAVLASFIAAGKIRYHFKKNEERAVARNVGAKLAQGSLLKFLDSDDLIEPNYLACCVAKLTDQSQYDAVYTNVRTLLDGALKNQPPKQNVRSLYNRLWEQNDVAFSSVLIRKDRFLESGGFDETRALSGAEDWEFWVRLTHRGVRFGLVPEYVTVIRAHEMNGTMSDINKIVDTGLLAAKIIEEKFGPASPANRNRLRARYAFIKAIYENLDGKKSKSWANLMSAATINPRLLLDRKTWMLVAKLLLPTPVAQQISRRAWKRQTVNAS